MSAFTETCFTKRSAEYEQLRKEVSELRDALVTLSNDFNVHKELTPQNDVHDTAQVVSNLNNVAHEAFVDAPAKYAKNSVVDTLAEKVSDLENPSGIDYKNWTDFFAYPIYDEDDNTVFLLARLSKDYTTVMAPKSDFNGSKPATLFLKYINGNPFDAIINVTCSGGNDTTLKACLSIVASRTDARNAQSYGLYKVTYATTGKYDIYIGVKDNNLIGTDANGAVSVARMLQIGINTIPMDQSIEMPTRCEKIEELSINPGEYSCAASTGAITITNLQTTDERIEVSTPSGIKTLAYTTDTAVPVAAMLRWANYAIVPDGYYACDGRTLSAGEYPELARVFGIDPVASPAEAIVLPIEDNAIIKVRSA